MPSGFRVRQVLTAATVASALRPPGNYWLGVPAMFTGWLAGEMTPQLLTATAVDGVRELTRERKDRIGLALAAASAAGMGLLLRRSIRSRDVVAQALDSALGPDYGGGAIPGPGTVTPWGQLAFPFVVRDADVEKISGLSYGPDERYNNLDVFRRRGPSAERAPILLHIHGGMWMSGDRRYEGLPVLQRMARHGWLGVNIDYRLSPRNPFPAQIVDVKRAIAWIREHAAEFGGDPSFIAVTGGSAGGHLAALAALTPNDPQWQPGFEEADTSVQAAMPHYGIFDFAAQSGTDHAVKRRDRFLARYILKKDPVQDLQAFVDASPVAQVNPDAPPFFVIHGSTDTGVEVGESSYFVEALRSVSRQPVAYAELVGGSHGFDVVPSIRSSYVLGGVERFLAWAHGGTRA